MSNRQPVDASAYLRLFQHNQDGLDILEELVARFGGNPYVPGPGGDRDTAHNAGQNKVVQFILNCIAKAEGAPDDEDSTFTAPDERSGGGR